jgi:hypothetical protein
VLSGEHIRIEPVGLGDGDDGEDHDGLSVQHVDGLDEKMMKEGSKSRSCSVVAPSSYSKKMTSSWFVSR